jgi:hypothetical protein
VSEVLGKIGGFFSGGGGKAVMGGLAGAGEIGNILNAVQRNRQIGKLNAAEDKFANMTPEQLSAMVNKATQPLDTGLVSSINNMVQADMATRGLSQAPGIFAATEAQALAPYKLQEQQLALQLVLKQLGLPIEYANAIIGSLPKDTNIMPILLSIMRGNAGGSTPGITMPTGGVPHAGQLPPEDIGNIFGGGGGGGDTGGGGDFGGFGGGGSPV